MPTSQLIHNQILYWGQINKESQMNRSFIVRIVSALVLLAVLAGIGIFAYQAGVARGLSANPGDVAPFQGGRYGYMPHHNGSGFGMPFGMPMGMPFHGFGFGIFGFLFTVFILVLAFGALRAVIWGPRWGWGHRHGGGEHFVPPMFDEWHKRAHGESSEEKKE